MAYRLLHVAVTTVTLLCAVAVGQEDDSKLGNWPPDCSTTNNYTDKSEYKKNLDQLLGKLPGEARRNGWFYKDNVGEGADKVFGLIMCYVDYNETQCLDCLTRAPKGITTVCPGSRNVGAMYDACVLRYSDTPIQDTVDNYLYGVREFNIFPNVSVNVSSDADKLQVAWVLLMSRLTGQVTVSPLRISNSSAPFLGSEKMFGLAQCTRDVNASECSSCISNYITTLEEKLSWWNYSKGGGLKGYTCYLRYQVHALDITLPPPPSPQPSPPGPTPTSSSSEETALVIGLSIGAASSIVIVIGLLMMWLHCLRWWKQWELLQKGNLLDDEDEPDMEDDEFDKGTGPKRFRYGELAIATDNFSDKHKLGEGGFGSVYRGFLQEMNLHVAIKRVSKSSRQGRKEYASEVRVKSRLRHRNLVQLIGWCHGCGDLLLVYELMPNGSLDKHLHGATNNDGVEVLPWPLRHEIVLGLGSALLYLHEEWEQCVVHRDIKPSNVMLDAFFHARLGDFGLARLVDHGQGSHTTVLAGTMGYIDPECTITGRFSKESDIYSLGVLLLEVACGQRPVVVLANDTVVHLAQQVYELHKRGLLLDAADPRLNGDFNPKEMERMLLVGLWCTLHDRSLRPSIRQVVSALRFEAPPPSLPDLQRRRMPVASCCSCVPAVPFGLFNSAPSCSHLPGDDKTRTGTNKVYLSLSTT